MKKEARFNFLQKIVLVSFSALALIGLLWIIRWVAIDKVGIPQALANDATFTLSMDNGDIVRGAKGIIATGSKPETKLSLLIDEVPMPTKPVMQLRAMLTFEADGMKSGDGFKNSIWVNDKLAYTFDQNLTGYTKMSVPINADLLQLGNNKITIRAGTKKSPDDQEGEHDLWKFRALKFELGDRTVLDDPNYKTATIYTVGSPAGTAQNAAAFQKEFNYVIKEDKYRSAFYLWDTDKLPEGSHKVELIAEEGTSKKAKTIIVQVDNTAPVLEIISPVEGRTYKNRIVVNVKSVDAISGDSSMVAKLDGKVLELPAELQTAELQVGTHKLEVTTSDKAGNETNKAVSFQVLNEMPELPIQPAPADRSTVSTTNLSLSVQVNDSTKDPLEVSFYKARRYDLNGSVNHEALIHAVDREPPLVLVPEGETAMTTEQRALVATRDQQYLVNDNKEKFPYHRFTFEIGNDPLTDSEVVWTGHSLPDRLVTMYIWNFETLVWEDADSNRGTEDFTLKGRIKPASMVRNGKVEVLVQDRIPKPDEYDFAFLWMSDTQYYSESFPKIYDLMTKWTVDNWKEKKFNYMIHTGDIVNNWNSKTEWENASKSMKTLDDANIPYGIVAGNHDVAYDLGNYEEYWKYFGRDRYVKQPTFGGDLNNNRDHYDLVSVKGHDFVIVYLGWVIDQKTFDWADGILKKYADRNAILATHEYLKPNHSYFGQGRWVYERLVEPNPNVFMVLGGHNPGVAYNIKKTGERTVLELLSNYQNGPEGGQGFMRFLQFDVENKRLLVNTYSPYLKKYNFFKSEEDEFILPLNLKPIEKRVATDYIGIYSRTNELIGKVAKVPSGQTATIPYSVQPGQTYPWYAIARDDFGGLSRSEVWTFTAN
ncbi:metallophosphoesterase [Paenibacillus agricola]|uniref:Metallophosphoesterase n=1 Tax=Paenibacillus agricola TaxID=2716264 RepID=A0ABX0JE26_9BACL|nr:metallophosphoesterase [Paenibacillus agricola]NHN34026.1 metallophosphoesterase [Paenibacillus agricola]